MKQNLFDLIPEIDQRLILEKEGEFAVIAFPRFKNKFFQKFVAKEKTKIIRVRLDENGTAVWSLIDGKRSVGKIAELLAEHFNHEENYEYRVTQFVGHLYKQGYVNFKKQ